MRRATQAYDIDFDVPLPRPLGFTSLDTIDGTLHLTIRSTLNLSCIEVSLEGIASTSLNLRRRQLNGSEKTAQKEELHRLVNISRIVFPNVNSTRERYGIRNGENVNTKGNAEYILGPGSYEFSFQIDIPLNSHCYDHQKNTMKDKRKGSSSSLFSQMSVSSNTSISSNSGSFSHVLHPLPPSLNNPEDYYFIQYLLTATIHRKSRLKHNIILSKPIKMVPFTPLKYHTEQYSNQTFVRKKGIFKSKIPSIIAVVESIPSSHRNILSSSPSLTYQCKERNSEEITVYATDVPFGLEARIKGGLMTIGQSLDFKLYIVSNVKPEKYMGIDGKTSKLGLIILKRLDVTLKSTTEILCHGTQHSETKAILIHSLDTHGSIDLAYSVQSTSHLHTSPKPLYEISLPKSLYDDYSLPLNIAPSFETCNIRRKYILEIRAIFQDQLVYGPSKSVEIKLDFPLTIISGVDIPRGEAVEVMQGEVIETGNQRPRLGINDRRLPSYDEAILQDGRL